MTNYNGRLDEVLDFIENYGVSASADGFDKTASRAKAKQAITSLIKELLEEVKPEKHLVQEDSEIYDDYDHDQEQLRHELQENNINIGHNSAIDLYEQNLLKELEEL